MAKIEQILKADEPRRARVLFFHGLDGDPHTTWGAKNKDEIDQHFWPAWLKAEVKDFSVYSVGYCAHILKLEGPSPHFFRETWDIFDRLLETPELQDEPLFLVGHSLGGLVIKQLIRTAEGDAFVRGEAKQFLERIEKIVFLATPHRGSKLARLPTTTLSSRICYPPQPRTLYG